MVVADRASVLQAFGASEGERVELLRYNDNRFDQETNVGGVRLPLDDEPFVAVWERYRADARMVGDWTVLRRALVQLRFSVESGMSRSPAYRAAVHRLEPVSDAMPPLRLARPDDVRIVIHATPAGRLPVIVASHRNDFVLILQALTMRNEPVPVPDAVGACMVVGYVNVDRVRRLQAQWQATHRGASEAEWRLALRALLPRKELYLDRFIVASASPYSGVPADWVGLDAATWRRLSLRIRIEHESVHYLTRRAFGSMQNRLLDELMADYAGIVHACGRYRADWALRFLGLEGFPAYRHGARLERYRDDLSDGAFRLLQRLVKRAVDNLAAFDASRPDAGRPSARLRTVVALTRLTVEDLAANDAAVRLRAALGTVEALFRPVPAAAPRHRRSVRTGATGAST